MKGCYNGLQAHYIQSKAISSDNQMAVFSNPNLPFKKRNVSHKHGIIVQNRFSTIWLQTLHLPVNALQFRERYTNHQHHKFLLKNIWGGEVQFSLEYSVVKMFTIIILGFTYAVTCQCSTSTLIFVLK